MERIYKKGDKVVCIDDTSIDFDGWFVGPRNYRKLSGIKKGDTLTVSDSDNATGEELLHFEGFERWHGSKFFARPKSMRYSYWVTNQGVSIHSENSEQFATGIPISSEDVNNDFGPVTAKLAEEHPQWRRFDKNPHLVKRYGSKMSWDEKLSCLGFVNYLKTLI